MLNLIAGTTRHLLTLDHLLCRHLRRRIDRLEPAVLESLRVGAFQLVFCLKIPPHAAVSSTVEAAKALAPRGAGTVNAVLRALGAEIEARGPLKKDEDPLRSLPDGAGAGCRFRTPILPDGDPRSPSLLSIRFSLPAWLLERWVSRFGPGETERLSLQCLAPPVLLLRPNPARGDAGALATRLAGAGVEAEALPSGAVRLLHPGDLSALPGWAEGAFSVQDAAGQTAAGALGVGPGERILDLCAGVGGKACALAEQAGPEGKVVAVDFSGRRLARLLTSAARLGLSNIEIHAGDALALPPAFRESFDAVLLDAPCTNTGVLRRRPEARWRLTPQDPARLAGIQARLLEAAAPCVKPGGRLVYSTCSLETEENEGVRRAFAASHPGFTLESEALTLPSGVSDGGYWARLRR
jgi:16S rRNA (cytosine967-C5)-methyltransferase